MNQPHNPGMSEKAWNDLHKFVARMRRKYYAQLMENRQRAMKEQERINA